MEKKSILKNNNTLGILAATLGGTFWGFSGCCGQYLFSYKGATSSWLVPIRLFFSGILILTLLTCQKKNIFELYKNKKDRVGIILFALFGMMMSQYGYFTAVQYSNAGTATVLQYLGQIMLLVYVCVTTPRLPKKFEWIALVLSLSGIFIMATQGKPGELSINAMALLFGILAAVGFVCYSVQPSDMIRRYTVLPVLGWGMFFGGMILGLIMRPWRMSVKIDGTVILLLACIIILGSIAAYSLILTAIRLIGPVKTSLIACVEPVVAAVLAAVWLKTSYTAMDIIGSILILLSVVAITLDSGKDENNE